MRQAFKKLLSRNSVKVPDKPTSKGWIGVDLDGTLAHYEGWYGPANIGDPVPTMVQRVHQWIGEGYEVRIFTARASVPEYVPFVQSWLEQHGLPALKVTNRKDFSMIMLWDDRCIEVVSNTGEPRNTKPE